MTEPMPGRPRRLLLVLLFSLLACSRDRSVAQPGKALVGAADAGANGPTNVLGGTLATCGTAPVTGFFRDGRCVTGPSDRGTHVVCAQVTEEFLAFTGSRGNDLSTPRPELRFPGLTAGDRWCLCALRWREALEAGKAPPVDLAATDAHAVDYVTRDALRAHALEGMSR